MRWWPWGAGAEDAATDGESPTPPIVSADRVATSVERLRGSLRRDRPRLRPDAWDTAWRITEGTAQLLPSWDRAAGVRGAEALSLAELLEGPLPRSLDAFLAIPDAQKPAHADELASQLTQLGDRATRLQDRLTRALTSALHAHGELLADPDDAG